MESLFNDASLGSKGNSASDVPAIEVDSSREAVPVLGEEERREWARLLDLPESAGPKPRFNPEFSWTSTPCLRLW